MRSSTLYIIFTLRVVCYPAMPKLVLDLT